MDGFIIGNRFIAMMDSGAALTIFALDEIKQIMKPDNLQRVIWIFPGTRGYFRSQRSAEYLKHKQGASIAHIQC